MATPQGMRDVIEERLRALILGAPAPLTGLKLVIRGYDFRPQIGFYPFAEIFGEDRQTVTEETQVVTQDYLTHIGVSVLAPDIINPDYDQRTADVPSYLAVGGYIEALRALLLDHRDLDQVAWTDAAGNVETAWYLELRDDHAGVEQRQNNYTNFGRVSFVVHTRQQRAQ